MTTLEARPGSFFLLRDGRGALGYGDCHSVCDSAGREVK